MPPYIECLFYFNFCFFPVKAVDTYILDKKKNCWFKIVNIHFKITIKNSIDKNPDIFAFHILGPNCCFYPWMCPTYFLQSLAIIKNININFYFFRAELIEYMDSVGYNHIQHTGTNHVREVSDFLLFWTRRYVIFNPLGLWGCSRHRRRGSLIRYIIHMHFF